MKRWNNEDVLTIQIETLGGNWQEPELGDQFGDILPTELSSELVKYAYEANAGSDDPYSLAITGIDIRFKSEGYSDPGHRGSRHFEAGIPPEGEDNRTLVGAMMKTQGRPNGIPLPKPIAEALYGYYNDRINAIEMDVDNDEDVLNVARNMRHD